MTEVNDLVSLIDNLKAELFPRFKHLLQSIAALEARVTGLDDNSLARVKTFSIEEKKIQVRLALLERGFQALEKRLTDLEV